MPIRLQSQPKESLQQMLVPEILTVDLATSIAGLALLRQGDWVSITEVEVILNDELADRIQ